MSDKKLQNLASEKDSINLSANGYTCSIEDLYVEEGFNIRDIDLDHLIKMTESWMAGAVFPPLQVEIVNGKLKIVDGHHRYYSYLWAVQRGDFSKPAISIVEFIGSELEQIVHMVTSSEGKPLETLERASAYFRMHINNNASFEDIAKAVSETRSHVESNIKMFEFVTENERYESLVRTKIITASRINKYINTYKENAELVLSREIGIKDLDLESIQTKPDPTKLTSEEYKKANSDYINAIKSIKQQIRKNTADTTYKKPSAKILSKAYDATRDIAEAIQNGSTEGNKGKVTITLDKSVATSILEADIHISVIDEFNTKVKQTREDLGIDIYEKIEKKNATEPSMILVTENENASEYFDDEESSEIQGDISSSLEDSDIDPDDMNIDYNPGFEVENENQDVN